MMTARPRRRIAYQRIAERALKQSNVLVRRWLPDGQRSGGEWTALNPRRRDKHRGSFRINLRSGVWSDFATGDSGGDLISLSAYLFKLPQHEAARRLARALGIGAYEN